MLIITGLPCTGKTTLAKELAAKFKLPMISKDVIKESLFDSLGWGERQWSQKIGKATYPIMYKQCEEELKNKRSFIIESNFNPKFDDKVMQGFANLYNPYFIVIKCICDGEILFDRFKERARSGNRHPGHVDESNHDEFRDVLLNGDMKSLNIDASFFEIDTSDFKSINLQDIYDEIKKSLV